MPHGFCLQNLATLPCPHHLSCFSAHCGSTKNSGDTTVCDHLVVDREDGKQMEAIRAINRNAIAMVEMLSEDPSLATSPQLPHFQSILINTKTFL